MKRKIIFLVFLTVFIVIQAWFIYITFNFKYTGVTVEENKNHDWIIKQFDVANAPSVLGLQVGDIINKVNGKNPSDYIFIKKWRNLDQFQSLLVSRNGEQFEVMPPTNTWFWADAFYLTYIGESVSLAFALLLYIKIRSKSAQFLSLVFINIGFVFMSLSASIRGDVLGKVCIDVGVMLLPVVFFHFLIVLLKEKGNLALSHRFLKYLYVPILIILLAQFTYLNTTKVTFYIYQVITLASILYFLIGLLLNFIFLTFCYFKHRKEKTYASTIIKMVWYTLFISFSPIACFSFIPQLLYGHGWIDSPITGWAILLFPISFAYLIATKQLYDIDTIVRRIFLTTLISIVPAAFIVAFISIFLPKEELINRLLLIFAFIVIVISFILYTLEYFIIKFESIMFPRKHHLRTALKKIAKNLGNISSMRELKEIILVDIVQTMEVFGGAVVFKYHNDKEIELIEEGKIDLIGIEQVLAAADSEESDYTVIPINRHEEYTSYLVMTRKKTNTHLNLEEKQWLGLIISYLAVSLENLYLIRRLTLKLHELAAQIPDEKVAQDFVWFRKLMFDLQEKERLRIAMDLHDTTMQDLFFLKGRISSFLRNHALTEEENEKLASIFDYIEIINSNLRHSCFELHPHLLQEVGLIETIQQVIEQEEIGCPFEIEFLAGEASAIEVSSLETKRHLFRIFQELLNNAKKHSKASKVRIQLTFRRENFYFLYEDDGVGFDQKRRVTKEIGSSGNGIEQMKSRVIYMNGHIKLNSEKGHGVKIKITLPKEGLTA